jgi:hypothetical protein
MSIIATDNGGKEFQRLEPGMHQAVCSHVIDLGEQDGQFGKKHQVAICWETVDKMSDGRPFMQSKIYTLSLNEKATLRHHLEMWRGSAFTVQELAGFDIEALQGVNCYLSVMDRPKGDKIYTEITAINKLPANVTKIVPVGQAAPAWILKIKDKGVPMDKNGWPVEQPDPIPEDNNDLPF